MTAAPDAVRRQAIIDDLEARGLIQDSTDLDQLRARLAEGPITVYCGFDPTADSLHIGNLVPLLVLRRFQDHGHRPIALAGGATGMIGDPSGRSDERNLLDDAALSHNLSIIRRQLDAMLRFQPDPDDAELLPAVAVDNREWTVDVGVLTFLRDVGKHVTVNTMLAKESIRSRVDSESGISFTEFSYMLLQANDFFELYRGHQCELQVGGSDQWGNITAGIDMIRRRSGAQAYGLTVPLVTRSDGAKFGKSVGGGGVWLATDRTSPFELHQYFVNTTDDDVERFLQQLTLLPLDEIADIMDEHRIEPAKRLAQYRLADEITGLLHGEDAAHHARRAAAVLFAGEAPRADDLANLRGIVPETEVDVTAFGDEPFVDVLVASGLSSSRRDARQSIADGAIRWNGDRLDGETAFETPAAGVALLQKGKRSRHLVVFP